MKRIREYTRESVAITKGMWISQPLCPYTHKRPQQDPLAILSKSLLPGFEKGSIVKNQQTIREHTLIHGTTKHMPEASQAE